MLRGLQGISYAEALAERDGDAYTYMIESAPGSDIRKKLFYRLAECGWPMIGMEALGMNLEDIFISVVDKSEEKSALGASASRQRTARRGRAKDRSALEKELGEALYQDAERQRAEAAQNVPAEDDDED